MSAPYVYSVTPGRRWEEVLLMILSHRLRPYGWMLLVAAVLLAVFSVIAIAAVASLSGAPNYAGDARHQALIWEATFIGSLLLCGVSIFVIVVARRRS